MSERLPGVAFGKEDRLGLCNHTAQTLVELVIGLFHGPLLFPLEMPRAVPFGGRRIGPEAVDALHQGERRTIVGTGGTRRGECRFRLIPAPRAIGREPFGIAASRLRLPRREFTLA